MEASKIYPLCVMRIIVLTLTLFFVASMANSQTFAPQERAQEEANYPSAKATEPSFPPTDNYGNTSYPKTDLAYNAQAGIPSTTEATKATNASIALPDPSDSGFFAPPPPPPPPPPKPPKKPKTNPELLVEEFSYYTFKDEHGVTHLTDAPVDPRFRLITVQITISRGLAPYRRLNLEKVKPFILAAAERYRLDPALIASIIKAESAFDPKAVSWAGARGLMQLMPKTALMMGVTDSFDPEQNIMGGSRYLRDMLNRFNGDLSLAVAAYNCGPERVARVGRIPEITETKNYVKTVLANLRMMGPIFSASEVPRGEYASRQHDYSTVISFPDPKNVSVNLEREETAQVAPAPEKDNF